MGGSVERFKIEVPQEVLDDLSERLGRTRWPDDLEGAGWKYGANLEYMKDLVRYWREEYDWRRHEAEINAFDHFMAGAGGTRVHFIHQRGKGEGSVPLLLVHGWPDSFYRYHKVIPLLTGQAGAPGAAFDVVVPSIPGFGFSERKALAPRAAAELLNELMTDVLGYDRYMAAGGDMGAIIVRSLSLDHSDRLVAAHYTDVGYPDASTDFSSLSPAEREYSQFIQGWWMEQGAFNMVQSTKPQSLAYGLSDSPAGLAGWLINFFAMMEPGEEIEKRIPRDEILTNIMIYWVTGTINPSMRIYYEAAHDPGPAKGRGEVPAAVAHGPMDGPLPREWAERRVNLKCFTELPRGGHFLAWEEPEQFAWDVRESAETMGARKIMAGHAGR